MLNAPTIASRRTVERANFIICNECFWCASLLSTKAIIEKCPSCHKNPVESLPIFQDETYTFDYTDNADITLEFSRENGKGS
jgi:hypothetical protein